jgi:hypothetical protein
LLRNERSKTQPLCFVIIVQTVDLMRKLGEFAILNMNWLKRLTNVVELHAIRRRCFWVHQAAADKKP